MYREQEMYIETYMPTGRRKRIRRNSGVDKRTKLKLYLCVQICEKVRNGSA